MLFHELLGEDFAPLEFRSELRRANDRKPARREFVHQATNEGKLRTHNRQVRPETIGKLNERGHVTCIYRDALRNLRNSAVAGCTPDMLDAIALAQLPRQCMLASTAANDQNFHANDSRNDNSSQRRLSNFSSFHFLAPRAQKWFYLAAMPWDFIAILVLLGVFVPWRGAVRIRQLFRQENLTTADRLALYASTLAFQWVAAALVLWRALSRHMGLRQLALALPRPWLALGVGAGLAILLLANQLISLRRMAQLPQDQQGLIGQIARKVMPQTTVERLGFLALVITVAICEEFLYRGFIQAIFQQTLAGSSAAGAFISAAFFSVAHLYQGKRGIGSTFVMGLIFSGARILTASLFPSMLAHLATDLSAGLAAPALLSKPASSAAAACCPGGQDQGADK